MSATDDIEKVVAKAAREALTLEPSERLFALKVLAPYYTILRKMGPPENSGENTFADFSEAMHGEKNGSTTGTESIGLRDSAGRRDTG